MFRVVTQLYNKAGCPTAMALNKLRQLDQDSAGITLPKDELRFLGLLNENGQVDGEYICHIQHNPDDLEWRVRLVDELEFSVVSNKPLLERLRLCTVIS